VAQNIVSLDFTDEQIAGAVAGVHQASSSLPGLIGMESGDRRGLTLLGPKSQAFARQALRVLEQNPHIVPASLNLAEAQADLAALDKLAPVLEQLQRLTTQVEDTVAALGSDVMSVALEGYAHIKLSGAAHGLDDLRKELGTRFAKTRRKVAEPA
jgi:hypothetical protein